MKRIDTSTRAIDLFGAGKDGFKDGNLALGVAPTDLNALWFNLIQEELANAIEDVGIALDGTNRFQLRGALRGRLIATRVVSSPGAVIYNPTVGTKFIDAEIVGGGGAGGGSTAAGAGAISVAGGGGAGAYARGIFISGFAGITLSPGAGGVGVAGAGGGAGGTTSVGGLLTAGGGTGSGAAGAVVPSAPYREGGTAPSIVTAGANVVAASGGPGLFGFWLSNGSYQSGGGGASFFGAGGGAVIGSGAGASAASPGGGGSGAITLAGGSAFAGGNGGNGTIIIREYA